MDIVVYGSIAGRFYDKARSLFMHRGGKMKFGAVKSLGMYHHFWRVILLGFSVFVLLNVQGQINLKISGDEDHNLGQDYVVNKVVQGSFHQDNPRFGSTAGIQCTCN